MQEPEELNPANREFELALRQINPAETGIDRGEFAYQLGRASAQRRVNLWRAVGAVSLCALCLSLLSPFATPSHEERAASQHKPDTPRLASPSPMLETPEALSSRATGYLGARVAVLEHDDVELERFFGLPPSPGTDSAKESSPATVQALRQKLLN